MPPPSPTEEPGVRIDAGRVFKYAPDRLIGRDEYIRRLDVALGDAGTRVVTLVAWGGVGKTSLVAHWMARLPQRNWPRLDRVFAWSFYSQGTREQGGASADDFVKAALEFFGDTELAESATPARDKGQRIARLAVEHRTLLVLDGLEPLQHPPGGFLEGRLQDPAIEALLVTLAQSRRSVTAGVLCVVTTREPITDLRGFQTTTAPEWALEHLVPEAGAAVLWNASATRAGAAGIKADDRELRDASEEVGGHALTLQLLGSFLSRAHRGDIRRRTLVRFDKADAAVQGGHAFRVMGAYERWLAQGREEGARQLAVLRLLGLFDRPADPACLAALREPPAIPGLSEPLVQLDEEEWNLVVSALESAGLVKTAPWERKRAQGFSKEKTRKALEAQSARRKFPLGDPEDFAPPPSFFCGYAVDTHPLLREHFAKRLWETNADAWRESHRRLYEHLNVTVPYWPEGLDGLQPLYQAVAHGCQAGLYEEARAEVYSDRILRGTGQNGFYSIRKLGAFGADLGAVVCFFEKPWKRVAPGVSEADQAWLLGVAAFNLRALGRLTEAVEPMRATIDGTVRLEDWANAARNSGNLSELELVLGEVVDAVRDAKECVELADRSSNDFGRFMQVVARATLADAWHQWGRRAEALERFREAESMQAQRQSYSLLYSLTGFQYCDLLLAESERAAWATSLWSSVAAAAGRQEPAHPPDALCDVEQRAAQTIKIAEESRWLLNIALDHLTLGRVALYQAVLEGGTGVPAGQRDGPRVGRTADLTSSHRELTAAMDGLRAAGQAQELPRGLLSRAWLRFVEGDTEGAQADLDESWQIAERGSMKLHMADILLHRARLFRDRAALDAAARLIEETGYHRRDDELRDAQEAAQHWPQKPDYPLTPEADSSDTSGVATLDADCGSTHDSPAAAQDKPMPDLPDPNVPKPVFISYAHKDNEGTDPAKRWLDRLTEHLEPLVQQDNITVCSDRDIGLGDDWHGHIQTHLNGARAAVLLVSPAFLASKYIRNNELPVLLRNAKASGVKIIPVILRPCLFEETKFKYPDPKSGPEEFTLASLQAAGSPTKALSETTEGEQDRILVKVAQALARLVNPATKAPSSESRGVPNVVNPAAVPHSHSAVDQPMKATMLFLAANPDGVTKLALDEESRAIRTKIRSSDFRDSLRFQTEWAVRPDDLLQYLNEHRPHIVHFSGHGSPSEELVLHDETGQPKLVSKPALRVLFATLKDNIRLVVLNACYSRSQAEAIVEVIDCAVGMRRAIGDKAAIVFAASFYRALGFGRSVKEAFEQGQAALLLEGIREENTLDLLVKQGVDAARVFLVGSNTNP